MASASRSFDTDILQVRKVFARTTQNGFIPSSHILIANGDGGTRWNSVSSIFPVSSFGIVCGNSSTTKVYADLSFNLLQISTTGVGNLLQSYADPVSKVLMLSNVLPPIAVSQGSVPAVTQVAATTVPNPQYLTPITGYSTIKYLGVNDIQLSTVTTQNAMFISISSFTSAGYSTISGETFKWRPTLYSTLSTTAGFASFVSSVGAIPPTSYTGIPMSTTGNDLYFSSITFSANHLMRYIDTHTNSSRMFVELAPSLFLPPLYQVTAGNQNVIKEISSYLEINSLATGRVLFQESINTKYITSQIIDTNLSNYFTTPVRMQINPYTLQTNVNTNFNAPISVSTNVTVYHRIVGGLSNAANPGFYPTNINYDNRTSNGLYIQLMSATQIYP